jgi:cytochrome P450
MSSVLHQHVSSLRTLPGPRGLPVVGSVPSLLRTGVFEFMEHCWRQYGDIFQIHTGGRSRLIVVSHPDAVERILQGNVDNYYKGRSYDPIRPLVGNGLVTSTGDFWVRQRKLTQPAFSRVGLRRLLPAMTRCVHDMLAAWEAHRSAGTILDIHAEMNALTQRVIGFTLFGLDLSGAAATTAQAVADSLHIAGERVNRGALVLPLSVPTPTNLRYKRALRTLDTVVYDIISAARRRSAETEDVTLLRMLIDARDPDTGEAMNDKQLRDEIITHFVAGHETTALVLTWTFYLLDRHPEVVERMAEEVATFCATDTPSFEQLDQLTYTHMVLDEVMRLRPPVWAQTRVTHKEDLLLGYPIPADSIVLFSSHFCHRHPAFWDDPEAFRPERFTPEAVKQRHRYAHFPFSAGPRACIGKRFALYELTLALALILPRFRVELLPGQTVGMKVGGTCHPDRPIMVRLAAAPRSAHASS